MLCHHHYLLPEFFIIIATETLLNPLAITLGPSYKPRVTLYHFFARVGVHACVYMNVHVCVQVHMHVKAQS